MKLIIIPHSQNLQVLLREIIYKKRRKHMYNEQKNELSVLVKRKITKMIIIAVIILIPLLAIFFKGYSNATAKYEKIIEKQEKEIAELSDQVLRYTKLTKEVSIDLIESQITNIAELATIDYLYTNAGKFESPKQLFGQDIPFTTKSFIAKWDGSIKAGIKADKIKVKLNKKTKEIIISIPKAEILSHEIDKNGIETLDEQDGLFNPVRVDDVRNFDAESQQEMEERAIENGILDKAFENAKVIIEKLINNEILKEQGYTLKFKEIV